MNLSLTLALAKQHSLKFKALVPHYRRLLLPVFLCVLLLQTQTRDLTLSVLSDAFWQVAVFVAMTLTIYHLFADKISHLYVNSKGEKKPFREIVTASLMGILPGCGGAIVVITQYVSGRMSFGAVAAVLTSTMGDAAFLLLAAEPVTGLGIVVLCFFVGIVSGSAVNRIHGPDFLRNTITQPQTKAGVGEVKATRSKRLKFQGLLWQWLMIPGAVIGLLIAGQVDIVALFNTSEAVIQGIGAAITLGFIFLWAATREVTSYESIVSEDKKNRQSKVFQKVAVDTNFVTSWVVVAFLLFELVMLYGDFKIENLFLRFGSIAPLAGVLIGMIPGCGPQIITTSLYLSGAIPLSAQIGNAISNDGDALFPAIALSPKVAFVATIYSSIPAILAAYGYYWLFE
ncbi:putative manganese transporter [Cognaticolwellia mytili]|uniref:putative manganese transporter n=1 Tax=Cognaticolwellia mytili TaxID=1888913 RepID=UPI000A16DEDB|nr:putative manganese transporter [Cognaticolwellia mytili]